MLAALARFEAAAALLARVCASVPRMHPGPYESGNAGTARRVDDRLGRMPHGLDVVLM
jgi:hypothetical protein